MGYFNIYGQYVQDGTEFYHHGTKGQKWGKRNGPPYPLQKSSGSQKMLNGYSVNDVQKLFDSIPKGDVSYGQKHKGYKETIYRDMIPGKAFIELYKSPYGKGLASIAVDVHPNYRAKGLGTKLVNKAKSNMSSLGINRIEWYCDRSNVASVKLAEKCGFKIDDELSSSTKYTLAYEKAKKKE